MSGGSFGIKLLERSLGNKKRAPGGLLGLFLGSERGVCCLTLGSDK